MKKFLALAAAAAGAVYVQRKLEQQRAEKDLYAAAAAGRKRSADPVPAKDVWAAATDARP